MNLRTLTVLSILAALLLGWIWWFEYRQDSRIASTDERSLREGKIIDFSPDRVVKMRVQNEHGEVVLAKDKETSHWRVSSPFSARADALQARLLIKNLQWLRYDKDTMPLLQDLEPSACGLDPPRASVTLWVRDGAHLSEHTLLLGDKVPRVSDIREVYMRKQGTDVVFTASDEIMESVMKQAAAFRSRTLFALEELQVDHFQIEYPKRKIVCERIQQGGWRIREPVAAWANPVRLQSIIKSAVALQARSFVADAAADLLGQGRTHLTLSVSGQQSQTIEIGGTSRDDPSLAYVRIQGEPGLALVPVKDFEDLLVDVHEIRNKKLMLYDITDANEIRIEGPQSVYLRRLHEQWRIQEPGDLTADATVVRNFLLDAMRLTIASFVADDADEPESYGLAESALRLTVGKPDGRSETVLFGRDAEDTPGGVFAKRADEPAVFMVAGDLRDNMMQGALYFRDRAILQFDRAHLTSLRIARSDGEFVCQPTMDDQWQLVDPVTAAADTSHMNLLLWTLSTLKAETFEPRFSDEAALARYGLDAPTLRIRLEFDPLLLNLETNEKTLKPERIRQEAEAELWIGRKAGDAVRYACLRGMDNVFTLREDVVRKFNLELIDTTLLSYDDARLKGLVVEMLGYPRMQFSVLFDIHGKPIWRAVSPPDLHADLSVVAKLVDELDNLRASKYVAIRPASYLGYGLDALKLTIMEESRNHVLRIGRKSPDGGYFVRNQDHDRIAVAPSYKIERLLNHIHALVPAETDQGDVHDTAHGQAVSSSGHDVRDKADGPPGSRQSSADRRDRGRRRR